MQPIESIRSLLPAVNVKSVILDGPGQIAEGVSQNRGSVFKTGSNLRVRVKTTSITSAKVGRSSRKEKMQPKMVGAKIDIDYSEYIRIAVIQSRHAGLTQMLQTLGDTIIKYIGPLDQWRGNDLFDDIISSNLLGTGEMTVSDFKQKFLKIKTQKLFGTIDSPLLEKTDDAGNQIYSIPMDFNFSVDQYIPTHLTYFTIPYLELDSLADTFNTLMSTPSRDKGFGFSQSDFATISNIPTPLKFNTIFDASTLSKNSFFYELPSGKIWTGAVHLMPNGTYMTGNSHDATSQYVKVIRTSNVIIQDFRNAKRIMRIGIMNDFQDERLTLANILRGLQPEDRSLNPNNLAKDPYLSDLFLSDGTQKSCKFMFLINMDDLLTNNSVYGKLIRTTNGPLRNKVFNNSSIKSLKIYRRTVKKVIGTNKVGGPVDRYLEQNEAPVLICDTSQESGKLTLLSTSNFQEETNMSFSSTGLRAFNVSDRNFSLSSMSQYQYSIEIKVVDGTVGYFRREIQQLMSFVDVLKNYQSDILNSLIRPKEMKDNPHVNDMALASSRTRRIGGYDFRFDNLTPNFAKQMRDKYGSHLATGINSFIQLLRIFSPPQNLSIVQVTTLQNFLGLITDPNTTNPENISYCIQLLQESCAKMQSFVKENVRMTDPQEKKADYVVGFGETVFATHGAIEIRKKFNNILDLTQYGKGGYDYLSPDANVSTKDSANQVGLKTIEGRDFRGRIVREILKFFNTTQPNLTEGLTSQRIKYGGGDNVQSTSFSFLSPSVIHFNELPVDVLNADRAENSILMKFLQSKLVLNHEEVRRNGKVAIYDPEFRKNSFLANSQDLRVEQVAPLEQQRYFEKDYNLLPTPSKLIPLGEMQYPGAAPTVSVEDAERGSQDYTYASTGTSANALPSLYPASFLEKIFKRSLHADANTVPTETNIDLFDLSENVNFLKGVTQSRVSQLPNQIKALFISITSGNGGDVKFRPQVRKNIFDDPNHSSSSTLKYKLLAEIQYLDSFPTTSMSNNRRLILSAPMFKRLDADAFSRFTGSKVLCRLRKYEIPQWGLVRPPSLDTIIYDEYFLLQPDAPVAGADASATPGSFLDDATQDLISAAGWGLTDAEYALLAEFGTTLAPAAKARIASDSNALLAAKANAFKDAVFADAGADNFNFNTEGSNLNIGMGRLPELLDTLKQVRNLMIPINNAISEQTKILKDLEARRAMEVESLDTASED